MDADGPEHADEELDRGIDDRDRLVAAAAARAQGDPADERDVLEPRELVSAAGAARARTHHAQLARPSGDAHVEERSDAEAEDERVDRGERGEITNEADRE